MLVYLRLLSESFSFAMNALRTNKLRTLLSLLGVTIGIFSIIAVLAAVDSLDRKIKKDLSSLDKNTIYLFKGSFGPSDVPRWKRDQFPNVTYTEYEYLKNALPDAQELCFQIFLNAETVKYEKKSVSNVNVVPVSSEFIAIQGLEFSEGRFYNESESNSGAAVTVIGYDLAHNLFEDLDPIGKQIRLYGQRFTVIGVLKKQGNGMFGNDDSSSFIPVNFIRRKFGENNDSMTPVIVIKPRKGIDMEAFKADLTQKLRSFRGLKTGEIDNFFINVFSGFTEMLDGIISSMNLGGWIIAGFSLLVGGFGVANIMFVSVKERTNLIGIQKSLGAKNRFILFQFLFEAVILCLIGGIIGIILVWLIALMLTKLLDFEFVLSFSNILLGSGLAILIGLIAGILPAIAAAKLDPVEAIRSGM
ncbi:ABC transporter permease [Flavobacterium aciduliphilum]|uniref:Putative ABC transport system permease protein n=1 Tax=Flavobacterium aciduliphilum TaxID=1101402 RepID=A0A328YMQ6_9FLAO|nr:ABC transporter permease [Flavobacterium aciduliphilum]RAR74125.1 putative ABC transport system permease protein [Flavobacterium aciduliphilum]